MPLSDSYALQGGASRTAAGDGASTLADETSAFGFSTAVLVCGEVMMPVPVAFVPTALRLFLPTCLRDPLYKFVARTRYRIWKKTDECIAPDKRLRSKVVKFS